MRAKLPPFKAPKYTVKDFHGQFPDDAACLAHVFRQRFPSGLTCERCQRADKFTPIAGRRAYSCVCGFQVYPAAGTVFHKSTTPLKTWFHALYLMTASKNGVAALELQRHIGVTYKCPWRMMHQLRKLMAETLPAMTGTVEVDETFIGGYHPGVKGRGAKGKTVVVGVVERRGNVAATVVTKPDSATILPLIVNQVAPATKVVTDEYGGYANVARAGFTHEKVHHGKEEYVRGNVHTNTIEGYWSQMNRSIDGTHHHVSRRHLQKYSDEFAFRYNRRRSPRHMFHCLVGQLAGAADTRR